MAQQKQRRIVVTGALPYANGSIHLGHLVEYLQADFWTRFQKMRGHECLYICADDTHGTPIMVRARQEGITPEALIAQSHKEHVEDFSAFGVGFDHYSSTHSDENRILSEEIYKAMRDQKHTEVRPIQQLYCEFNKMFLPDRFVRGTCPKCGAKDQYGDSCSVCGSTYSPSELKDVQCSLCGRPPVEKQSDHVFFKLNHFRDFLKIWVPQHTAREISNKLNEWLDEELRDWDISRDEPYFGFSIPDLPGKYFYVWVDAPIGYISSTWQWCKKNKRSLDEFWKSPDTEIYHFIGKDIIYFHTLFWPAMLKIAGYSLPREVCVHGMLTVNGEKMSKSTGTFINARTYLNHLDPMYLRYYYGCKLSSHLHDLDLSFDDFIQRVNSDLIGKITNLGSRGAQMLNKRLQSRLGQLKGEGLALVQSARARETKIAEAYEARDFSRALTEIREIADEANKYFDERAPWKTVEPDPEGTRQVLTAISNVFRMIAIYLKPILPLYSDQVAVLFKENPYQWGDLFTVRENCEIAEYKHLAVRIEPQKITQMVEASKALEVKEKVKMGSAMPTPTQPNSPHIEIDDFSKVDLRIAKIVEASHVDGADKLLKLKVELAGGETRQIFAGIKSAYQPETLVGRLTVIVANLKPRQMKFGLSEGMVLAAGSGGKDLFILSPDTGAQPGDKVK